MGADAGVDRSLVLRVRSARGRSHVRARASARIHEFLTAKLCQGCLVLCEAGRLYDGFAVPVEPEPAEVFLSLRRGPGLDPRGIDVLDAEADAAAARPGGEPGDEVGAGIADVLRPRGGRGKPAAGWRGHFPRT